MIYLDNAATTLHKPPEVAEAVKNAILTTGNAARGAHGASLSASRMVFETRSRLAELFGCPRADHVVFTANSTEALNIAVYGLISAGDHVISTDLEHNSVLRPLYDMQTRGAAVDFVRADRRGNIRYEDMEALFRPNTKAVVCTHASNLTGNMLDIARIGAMAHAHGALLVIDATLGLTDQDQRVAGYAAERGCAMVIVLNKWDLVEGPEAKADIRERIADRMTFVGYAPVVAISALTGKKVDRIWEAIDEAYENFSQTIPTNKLNTWLSGIRETGHTVSNGKAVLRMKYVTQTGTCPPYFTFFVNRPDLVTDNYERFLENRLREGFDLVGTPVKLKFKKKD